MEQEKHLTLVLPKEVENSIKKEDEKFLENNPNGVEAQEYTSNMNIDRNIKEDQVYETKVKSENEDGQQELPGIKEEVARLSANPHERRFKVELVLKLIPIGDRPVNIPLCAGEFPSSRVNEVLELSLKSRRNKNIIEAVLDNPEPEVQKEEVISSIIETEEVKNENHGVELPLGEPELETENEMSEEF